MTGRARALTATFALAIALFGATAAVAEALPSNFWGAVPQAIPTAEQFQRLRRGGVHSVRIPIVWGAVQPTKDGALDWSADDALVAGAATAGIEVLPFITGAPTWAVPAAVVGDGVSVPRNLPVKTGAQRSAWASFLAQAVARYGPNGTFWAENPTVPRHPIRTWQVWNEENFKYFVARPNPAEYGKLVEGSYAAIKAADPGAKVLLGGMFADPKESEGKSPTNYFATDFLAQMYKRTPGIKSKFNGVALHPYAGHYQSLTPEIEEVRKVLKQNHDAGKGLWITELGWSSEHPSHGDAFAKGLNGQAAQLKGAFTLLRRNQRKWRIQQVYWFSVDDQAESCNFCDGSGLFGPGFKAKPAWKAYVRFAGGTAG